MRSSDFIIDKVVEPKDVVVEMVQDEKEKVTKAIEFVQSDLLVDANEDKEEHRL